MFLELGDKTQRGKERFPFFILLGVFLQIRTHLMKNTNFREKEKDWTVTRSSPHTLEVQNDGPANLM